MDNACFEVPAFWRRKRLNTHSITTSSIAAEQESDDEEFSVKAHALMMQFMSASKKEISANPELWAVLMELKEALAHTDRRRNLLITQKCDEDKPCVWCAERPWRCRAYYKFLKLRGMRHPSVSWSTNHEGHARSWLETKALSGDEQPKIDGIQPSVVRAGVKGSGLGVCPHCWAYGFKTPSEIEHHMSIVHRPFKRMAVRGKAPSDSFFLGISVLL